MHARKVLPLAVMLLPVAYTRVSLTMVDEEPEYREMPMLAIQLHPAAVAVMVDSDAYSVTAFATSFCCCQPEPTEAKPTLASA